MTDKLVNCERELKLGATFSNNKAAQYHTIKYDFKPASVDVNKMATVDVGTSNQVTVTVPHLDGAGVPHTVFKGNQRPYTKECVLIIDRVTGEITLEKLSSNIQVKKTRQESTTKPRPLTPVELTNTTQRSSSRTRVTSGVSRRINPVSGAGVAGARYPGAPHKTPPMLMRSPPRVKTSPPQAAPWLEGGHSTLASLPMIGLDEQPVHNGYAAPAPPPARAAPLPIPPERSSASDRSGHVERRALPEVERRALPEVDRRMLPEVERRAMPEVERRALPEAERRAPPERSAPERVNPLPLFNSQHAVQPTAAEHSSSSSSSDSGSDSDSNSDSDDDTQHKRNPPLTNGTAGSGPQPPLLCDVLNDDLCLSESGSDSD